MADSTDDLGGTSRRVVLAGVGGAGLLGLSGALAACGSGGGDSSGSGTPQNGSTPDNGASTDDSGGSGEDNAIAKTSDIPVGGGKIFDSDNVVVTQPTKGDFRAFSATCTHQACLVQSVRGGLINCPCHGSQYSIVDGSVVTTARGVPQGSQQPLPKKTVTVTGDNISVG